MKKLILLALLARPSWATITFLQSGPTTCNTGGAGASSQSCTFGSTVASGSLIIVSIKEYNTQLSSVTGTRGESFAAAAVAEVTSGAPYRVKIWYGSTTSAGSDTITVTPLLSTYIVVHIYEFGNIASTSPLDQSATNTTTSTFTNQTVGPSSSLAQADELIFVASTTPTNGAMWAAGTTGNGSTYNETILQQESATTVVYGADEWAESSGTGPVSASFTTNNSTAGYAIALATFKAAGGSAAANMMPVVY